MKRKLSVFSVLVLIIAIVSAMSACGQKYRDDVEPEEAYQAIFDLCQSQTTDSIALLKETNEGYLTQAYEGLFEFELEDAVFYQPPVYGAGCEITVLKVKNEDDIPKVVDICKKRIEIGSSDDFYPGNSATWKNNSAVLNYGRYVILICMPESITLLEDEVKALFK